MKTNKLEIEKGVYYIGDLYKSENMIARFDFVEI